MKNLKKFIAVACSATMILSSSLVAFAEGPSTTGGTGNVIAHSVETVTVPTSIAISFNPQKWDFKLRSTDATYSKAQIASLNYGIATMSSMDKKVKVTFKATGTAGTGGAIEFVDSVEAATAKNRQTNPGTAEHGEYKIYLAVAAGDAKVTASADSSATTFALQSDGSSNASATLLSDVNITPATKGLESFPAGAVANSEASIAFKLGKATYALASGQYPEFGTSQTAFGSMVEATALGDIVGFTFTGAMNEDADWTKANLKAIAITPTYEFEDIDGSETALGTNGGYNQLKVGAAGYALTLASSGNLTYQFAEGSYPTGTLTAVTVNGTGRAGLVTQGKITYNATNGFFKITADAVTTAGITQGATTIVATIGGTDYTFTY